MRKPMPQSINYLDLQKKIDELVSKHGTETAYFIIDSSLKQENIPYGKDTSLAHFIINAVCDEFGITQLQMFSKATSDLRPKWSAYHLILKHTDLKYKDIAWRFDFKNISPIQYGCNQVKELLSMPQIDKQHHEYHMEAEKKIVTFMQKMRYAKGI